MSLPLSPSQTDSSLLERIPPSVPPPTLEGRLIAIESALNRIALALEHIALPGSRSPLSDEPDGSRVAYVNDAEQLEREIVQEAYWRTTGRRLDPWEMPPRPVDENGNEWINRR
jgi:hypothetical protein